ncbi:MAG: hypothetical protein HQM13_01550 [SAR324 cluster bacterium]|nr:hypothetical protein [SAR324 cluster bacterium]
MQTLDIYSEKAITRQEINFALKEFLERGGTIKIYPPQVAEEKNSIPVPSSAYEDIRDLSFV